MDFDLRFWIQHYFCFVVIRHIPFNHLLGLLLSMELPLNNFYSFQNIIPSRNTFVNLLSRRNDTTVLFSLS